MNNLEYLKRLAYSLEYSGFIMNLITKNCGGESWIKINYNISNNLFDSFMEDAKNLNIIEKIDQNLKYKKTDIKDELFYWIGNKQIVKSIEYDIRDLIEKNSYELYVCDITLKAHLLCEYQNILDSIAMEGLVFIFKSNENISSIVLHWAT